MDINTTFWFFERIKEDNLCMLYSGNFSDEITNKLIELSEYNINNIDALSKMKKKASFLMAECFQNIVRHGEKFKEVPSDGFFLTKNWGGIYYITSGNLIEKRKIGDLKNQLEKVNSLSKEELKLLYREVLENSEISDKGGAGLGLIEMARKSGQKLDYLFENKNSKFSYFYNQIMLKSDVDDLNNIKSDFPLTDSISYHKKMVEENIMLIHKGDFSQDSIFPVLKIIEENLRKEFNDSTQKKKIFHILVELLQNISRHCLKVNDKKEGIFLLGNSESNFVINTGNLIENKNIKKFRKILDEINSLNRKELKNLYLSKLRDRNLPTNGGAGIGLIDIARRIISPLNYHFHQIDDEKSFFTLNVIA
ncbi:MAG: SiaB family protein kinase [Thiohalospira sp.]